MLLLEDAPDVAPEDGREVEEDDERPEAAPLVADDPLPPPAPEVTTVCDGRAEITILLTDVPDSTGCIRLLPIFVVSLLLITIPRLPEYPDGVVET